MPLNSVLALARSQAGLLWIGTEDGLSRFDGSIFEGADLAAALGDEPAYVESLALARDGSLLVGTSESGVLRVEDGNPEQVERTVITDDWVDALLTDADGVIWAAGRKNGLMAVIDGTLERFGTAHGLRDSQITALARRSAGGLWIGYADGTVQRFDRDAAASVSPELPASWVEGLLEARDGTLWVATRDRLYAVDGGRIRGFGTDEGLPDAFVETVAEDAAGRIWAGTATGGVARLCGSRFQTLPASRELPVDRVEQLLGDARGGMWVATGGGGIARLSLGPALPVTPVQGLPDAPVLPVLVTGAGTTWAGTYGAGLVKLEGHEVHVVPLGDSSRRQSVFALAEDPDGSIWAGTRDGLFQIREQRVRQRLGVADGLPHPTVASLLHEGSRLYVGVTGGVAVLERGELSALDARGRIGSNVASLLKDREGRLWVGSHGDGLYRLEGQTLEPAPFQAELPSTSILSLFEDSAGDLWIGTGAGLARWDGAAAGYLTTGNGLPEPNVYSIREDEFGDFWLSGNRGVYRIPRGQLVSAIAGEDVELSIRRFNRSDGMPATETNGGFQPAVGESPDGRLWYPTVAGLAVFDPEGIRAAAAPPEPRILALQARGSLTTPMGLVQVPAMPAVVEFAFSALELSQPEDVEYQYRVRELDPGWYTTRERHVAYRQMPPGRFWFDLRARLPGNRWSEPVSLAFEVDRHLLQYPATWIAAAILVLIAAWAGVEFRRRRLALRNQRIQDTQKLEALGQLTGGIAHDFNNILGVVIGMAEELAERLRPGTPLRQDVDVLLSAATRGSGLTQQLLAFASRGGSEPRLVDLSEEVAGMEVFLRRVLPGSIELLFDVEPHVGHCLMNPSSLHQVILNLAVNARDAMPEGGTLQIDLARASDGEDHARLTVSDSGTGMDRRSQAKLFEPFFTTKGPGRGTGLGLAVTHDIVRGLSGRIEVESELGRGMTFRVYLPIDRAREIGGAGG